MTTDVKNLADVILDTLKLLGAAAAAAYAYYKFFREGVHRPRIEFDIQCTFFGLREGVSGATFSAQIVNKGNVEHKFTRISLRLRGIKEDQPFSRRQNGQLEFPELILKEEMVPKEFGYFFVRPGITQVISFSTTIPSRITHVLARAAFKYENSDDLHTVERVFEVLSAIQGHSAKTDKVIC